MSSCIHNQISLFSTEKWKSRSTPVRESTIFFDNEEKVPSSLRACIYIAIQLRANRKREK